MVIILTSQMKVALPFDSGKNKLNFIPTSIGREKIMKHKIACGFKISPGISSVSPISESQMKEPLESTQWKLTNGKPAEIYSVEPSSGRLLKDGLIFRQNFTVRSSELGSDFKLSIEAVMNYLQDTSLNHLESAGIVIDGFGSTLEMTEKDLIWVACWSHMEVDHYPSWGDVVQVDGWKYRSGRKGLRRDWLIQDLKTGKTLIRATSLFAMMNKKTRKFAKTSEEVTGGMNTILMHNCDPLVNRDGRKLLQLDADKADYIRTGLNPGWTNMDVNQHVSHVKLVNYVLEGAPGSVVDSYELCAMTLEYRKECSVDRVLQSISKLSRNHLIGNQEIELDHSLSLEGGPEVVRGRTSGDGFLCSILDEEIMRNHGRNYQQRIRLRLDESLTYLWLVDVSSLFKRGRNTGMEVVLL
ncbi:palmitoyl-acyl carrier protein thioesterase, chloroplastic-like [Mangifera indica]|uniref:palmitoyl-acyl carrier protein thioesterase, chloroplastic-like n=1 Tax=Mangifera indica TaxID=29780 RepID=UPI001CFBE5CA|nr:palmitoyl-acyl carrier protein thioesterase, chloroplastic-like [Mangifera indica]